MGKYNQDDGPIQNIKTSKYFTKQNSAIQKRIDPGQILKIAFSNQADQENNH